MKQFCLLCGKEFGLFVWSCFKVFIILGIILLLSSIFSNSITKGVDNPDNDYLIDSVR